MFSKYHIRLIASSKGVGFFFLKNVPLVTFSTNERAGLDHVIEDEPDRRKGLEATPRTHPKLRVHYTAGHVSSDGKHHSTGPPPTIIATFRSGIFEQVK